MQPTVSVVVTTKNSGLTLRTCLTSIQSQTYNRIEIIVVDNNSTDNTKLIALDYTKHIFEKGPERSAQRNYGASKASGQYLLYIDSDMELSPRVIEECVELSIQNGIGALYIPEIIAGNSVWSRVRTYERSFYNATVIDAVRFVRKDVFDNVKGFDETLTGPEDWDFDKRVRAVGKVGIIHSPLYHHEEKTSIKTYLQKKMYYANDFAKYVKKWGSQDKDIAKQLGFNYRYIQVFTEKGKWRLLLFNPVLTILMFGLRFLLGVLYLFHYRKKT